LPNSKWCYKEIKISENLPWKNVLKKTTQILFNRVKKGKGRNSKKEFIQFCYIARGSLYETMTLLEIFRRRKWIMDSPYSKLEKEGIEIASMIKGLINSLYKSPE